MGEFENKNWEITSAEPNVHEVRGPMDLRESEGMRQQAMCALTNGAMPLSFGISRLLRDCVALMSFEKPEATSPFSLHNVTAQFQGNQPELVPYAPFRTYLGPEVNSMPYSHHLHQYARVYYGSSTREHNGLTAGWNTMRSFVSGGNAVPAAKSSQATRSSSCSILYPKGVLPRNQG